MTDLPLRSITLRLGFPEIGESNLAHSLNLAGCGLPVWFQRFVLAVAPIEDALGGRSIDGVGRMKITSPLIDPPSYWSRKTAFWGGSRDVELSVSVRADHCLLYIETTRSSGLAAFDIVKDMIVEACVTAGVATSTSLSGFGLARVARPVAA